jgi:hypothetical protein
MRTKATAAHANAARSAAMTTHDEQLRIAQNLLDELLPVRWTPS